MKQLKSFLGGLAIMDELISRQAAIDAMCDACSDWCDEGVCKKVSAIQKLPSAQSEIIRCKDCRWGKEACGNIECFADTNVPPEYHGYEWFCPNGERRTDG